MCGGGVCVGGGERAFYYTYIYNGKRESCEGAKLVCVLVAETIHPACMREEDPGGREAGAHSTTPTYTAGKESPALLFITAVPNTKLCAWGEDLCVVVYYCST